MSQLEAGLFDYLVRLLLDRFSTHRNSIFFSCRVGRSFTTPILQPRTTPVRTFLLHYSLHQSRLQYLSKQSQRKEKLMYPLVQQHSTAK